MQLFNNMPPSQREEFREKLIAAGNTQIVIFPAAYMSRMKGFKDAEGDWQGAELLWVTCSVMVEGQVAKAGPDFMIERAREVLTKYEQDFEVVNLMEEIQC